MAYGAPVARFHTRGWGVTAWTIDEQHAQVNRWLRRLGELAGFAPELDAEGLCAIGHRSGLECAIEVFGPHGEVVVRVPLMPWPPARPEAVASQCLQAHFLGIDTVGASFAIDPAGAELVLWKSAPLDSLDAERFPAWLDELFEAALRWRDALWQLDASEPACEAASACELSGLPARRAGHVVA